MQDPIYNYDEISDTLYISFAPGESATGVELNENFLLRINKSDRRVVGLSIFNYSIIAQRTESGPRSFPLTGLTQLSEDFRTIVLDILLRSPIKDILFASAYTPSMTESIPIASLRDVFPPVPA